MEGRREKVFRIPMMDTLMLRDFESRDVRDLLRGYPLPPDAQVVERFEDRVWREYCLVVASEAFEPVPDGARRPEVRLSIKDLESHAPEKEKPTPSPLPPPAKR